MNEMSLQVEAEQEALRHKWLESEKAGRDLGMQAVYDWVNRHWAGYCRAKLIEHLQGKRCWLEFGREMFGLLQRRFHDREVLLDRIMDRLMVGQENLHIICWALDWGLNLDDVIEILESLDINRHRLAFQAVTGQ